MGRRAAAVRVVPYGRGRTHRPVARSAVPAVWPSCPEPNPDRELAAAARETVQLVVEVLAGVRPVAHLARRCTPEVCRELAPHLPLDTRPRLPRVLSLTLQEPRPGAAEGAAVVLLAGRVQALALRLECERGRWRCQALTTTRPRARGPSE